MNPAAQYAKLPPLVQAAIAIGLRAAAVMLPTWLMYHTSLTPDLAGKLTIAIVTVIIGELGWRHASDIADKQADAAVSFAMPPLIAFPPMPNGGTITIDGLVHTISPPVSPAPADPEVVVVTDEPKKP